MSVVATTAVEPGLTRFVAGVLLFFACLATSRYALVTARYDANDPLTWRYVALASGIGAAYAALLVVEAAAVGDSSLPAAGRRLAQLFFAVFLALAMRELYYATPATGGEESRISLATARRIETFFIAVILVQFLVVLWIGLSAIAWAVQVLAAAAFTVYGVSFARAIQSRRMTSGTVLDVTVTYTIAVLLCVGAATVAEAAVAVGVPPASVDSVVDVLTVMSATFLVSLLIRLKRNVDAARHVAG